MLTAIWKLATKRILKRLPTEKWSLHQERHPSSPVYELVLRKDLVAALTDLAITDGGFAMVGGVSRIKTSAY